MERGRSLNFTFNGRDLTGREGDSLASALLANGVSVTARSFKYHRPRGIISCGHDEPGTLVELTGDQAGANQPAPTVRLLEGLSAVSVNCWPSPGFDVGALIRPLAPLLPAGFYYKTFIWPGWRIYEPLIRKLAGLAHAPGGPPPSGRFETRSSHCDALVVGAGPAGLSAAGALAGAGADVLLVDRGSRPGGCLNRRRIEIDGVPGRDWAAERSAGLASTGRVRFLRNAEAWAVREDNLVLVNERCPEDPGVIERQWNVRTNVLVTATGAVERMLVFPNNDRPGVMLASAIQCYIHSHGVRPGRRAVLFTNNDSVGDVARDMQAVGIEVVAIVDTRPAGRWPELDGVRVLPGHEITDVLGGRRVRRIIASPRSGGPGVAVDCDLLGVSGGWDPSVGLWSQAGGDIAYSDGTCAFVPAGTCRLVVSAGAAAGAVSASAARDDGLRAGKAAARKLGIGPAGNGSERVLGCGHSIEPFWCGAVGRSDVSFVDILNDVTVADIRLALREGFRSVEQVKRYTTAGMGFNQGKTVGPNVAGIVSGIVDEPVGKVGLTTSRSPTVPVSFGSIVGGRRGRSVLPFRHTPITQWNIEEGAVMYEAGARWRRPGYFPEPGDSMQTAVNREAAAVRNGAGVYDGSPLGTFAIGGPDAGRFLDMLFTNDVSDLPEGNCRYGIMLTDDGRILDDGVALRTGEHGFILSMSTGNAPLVSRHISKFLAIDRPDWRVRMTEVTCQLMNATLCGPKARDILAALGTDIDLSREAFPFMSFREGTVAGLPARVVRVSFTGSLSFEINVRPRDLRSMWDAIMREGREFGIRPVGSEASHVLRVEKGFLSIGHEADGTADPYDLGMGWLMSKGKADFIGKRSVELRRGSGKPRRELVGLLTKDAKRLVPEGAPITAGGERCSAEGFVSASVWSVVRERSVALALLTEGRNRIGEEVFVRLPDERVKAEVVRPCFFDPKGTELRS